ncbi:MAG: D,D-heptose 7-phosphate kinase [Schlesneria sp.]|nr:D,D-heptose 7-phosphate kinase [Schlesneria sp.]
MQLLRRRAYARAGLVGNPSDGYNGRTISFIIRNLWAEVVLYEWDEIEILWSSEDQSRFRSVHDLAQDVRLHGYYGGVRLVKATIKRFVEYCDAQKLKLHDRNFSIRYQSTIPRNVGLAGSSAIIISTLRALMDFYEVTIPLEVQPSLALSVETRELGITGGLQDRVIQCYEGLVSMDFSKDKMTTRDGYECGVYERLDPALLPPIYVAYCDEMGEPTEVIHNNLRQRYDRGDADVVTAMRTFADLARDARHALGQGDVAQLSRLIDTNFDTRRSICQLHSGHIEMIERARKVGATAKFAGSGGAIIGTYTDESMFRALQKELGQMRCMVLKPIIQ